MGTPNWVNRAIVTGDNLDILRKMNSESVDLIYLDPPFNSNRNYEAPVGSDAAGAAFKDTWTLSDLDRAWMGLIADTEPDLYQVVLAAGLAHGKGMQSYLCMMAVRLTEMKRVLRSTGSIYLHCDPTASHYLKTLMDVIYGRDNFKSDIIWNRKAENLSRKKWRRATENILYYVKSEKYTWNIQYEPLDSTQVKRDYRHVDENGRYTTTSCTNNADRPNMVYEFNGVVRQWRYARETMEKYDSEGLLVFNDEGVPRKKRYLSESKGRMMANAWSDINVLSSNDRQRVGFPTQKPLALLDRIIKASSDEGFMILDPFCGCATALVAAEMHGRNWIGIDLSEKAAELVVKRVKDYQGLFQDITHYPDVNQFPDRNDVLGVKQSYSEMKHVLFGDQEGHCNLCGHPFGYKLLELDHVIPKAKGGGDHIENRQLLCPPCNKLKGTDTMEAAVAKYQDAYANTAFMNASHGAGS